MPKTAQQQLAEIEKVARTPYKERPHPSVYLLRADDEAHFQRLVDEARRQPLDMSDNERDRNVLDNLILYHTAMMDAASFASRPEDPDDEGDGYRDSTRDAEMYAIRKLVVIRMAVYVVMRAVMLYLRAHGFDAELVGGIEQPAVVVLRDGQVIAVRRPPPNQDLFLSQMLKDSADVDEVGNKLDRLYAEAVRIAQDGHAKATEREGLEAIALKTWQRVRGKTPTPRKAQRRKTTKHESMSRRGKNHSAANEAFESAKLDTAWEAGALGFGALFEALPRERIETMPVRTFTTDINGLQVSSRRSDAGWVTVVDYVYPGTIDVGLGHGVVFTSGRDAQSVEIGENVRSALTIQDIFDDSLWTWRSKNAAPKARVWAQHVLAANLERRSRSYEYEDELVVIFHEIPARQTELALAAMGFKPKLATWRARSSPARKRLVQHLLAGGEVPTLATIEREEADRFDEEDGRPARARAQQLWQRWYAVFRDFLQVGRRRYEVKGQRILEGNELVFTLKHPSSGSQISVRLDVAQSDIVYLATFQIDKLTFTKDALAWEDFPSLGDELDKFMSENRSGVAKAKPASREPWLMDEFDRFVLRQTEAGAQTDAQLGDAATSDPKLQGYHRAAERLGTSIRRMHRAGYIGKAKGAWKLTPAGAARVKRDEERGVAESLPRSESGLHPIDEAIRNGTITREQLDELATQPLPPQGDSYWGDNMRDHHMDPVDSARVAALQMGTTLRLAEHSGENDRLLSHILPYWRAQLLSVPDVVVDDFVRTHRRQLAGRLSYSVAILNTPPPPQIPDGTLVWLPSDEETYRESLGALPPAAMRGGMFLLGEASRHDGDGRPMFRVFARTEEHFFKGSRPVTIDEFDALEPPAAPAKAWTESLPRIPSGKPTKQSLAEKFKREAEDAARLAQTRARMGEAASQAKRKFITELSERPAGPPGSDMSFAFRFGDHKALYIPQSSPSSLGSLIVMRWIDGPHPRPQGRLENVWIGGVDFRLPDPGAIEHGPMVQRPGYTLVEVVRVLPTLNPETDATGAMRRVSGDEAAQEWLMTAPSAFRRPLNFSERRAALEALRRVFEGLDAAQPLQYDIRGNRWSEPEQATQPRDPYRSESLPRHGEACCSACAAGKSCTCRQLKAWP